MILLIIAFPSVVGPEPQFGTFLDVVLEQTHVTLRNRKIIKILGLFKHQQELAAVISAAFAGDVHIPDMGIKFSGNTFGSGKDRCLAVEELGPVMGVPPEGYLIGYHSHKKRLA